MEAHTGESTFSGRWETLGMRLQRDNMKKRLRRNPPDVGVTSGQKPCAKIIYIVLQTSVGLF